MSKTDDGGPDDMVVVGAAARPPSPNRGPMRVLGSWTVTLVEAPRTEGAQRTSEEHRT